MSHLLAILGYLLANNPGALYNVNESTMCFIFHLYNSLTARFFLAIRNARLAFAAWSPERRFPIYWYHDSWCRQKAQSELIK